MYQPPVQRNQPYQEPGEGNNMDQSLPWQSSPGPNLGFEGSRGPNLHIGIQYHGSMNHSMMREQARSECQYPWNPLMVSTLTSRGSNPQPMAANVWHHSQVPSYPRDIFPEVPNWSTFHNPVFQYPMIPEDEMAGLSIAQSHPTNGHAWPQSNLQMQWANRLPDDFRQGNTGSFGDHVGDFGTPSIDYGAEQFPLPTPSPGSTAHGSPETPGSLYDDKMGSYLNQDEPWKPWSVDRENNEAIQNSRDRSYDYPYGQSISLNDW